MSTKRFCEPEKWNGKANRAIGNKEEVKALNAYLDVLQNQVYDAQTHLIDRGKIVTALALRDLVSGQDQRQRTLMTLFKSHNNGLEELIGKGVAKGTHTNFDTSYKHTEMFLKTVYKIEDINILSLDLEFIKKLYHWYRTVKKLYHNSALKYEENRIGLR